MKEKLKIFGLAIILAACFKLFMPHAAYAQAHYRPLPIMKPASIAVIAPEPIKLTAFTANSAEVCFTPGGPCTDLLVAMLAQAKQQVLVQAYQLTAQPIA